MNRWIQDVFPRLPSAFHEKRGGQYALSTFRRARDTVPAYSDFLASNNINGKDIVRLDDFRRLPIVDKKNYLHRYSTEELCAGGKLNSKYLIEGSSGLSGQRTYWPRMRNEDRKLPGRVEALFRKLYAIETRPTLVIVGLMLGVWVSGEKISWALRQIAINRKYPLSIITPGSNAEEILEIIRRFAPLYRQTVIIAYPPFIKYLTSLGDRENVPWPDYNIKLITGGEYFSEEWRDYMAATFDHGRDDVSAVLGIYGASEMSTMMARETPLSILIKKTATRDRKVAKDLFNEETFLPTLCQYNPSDYFIEAVNDELVFTALTAMPLVRYNIHDRGGLITFDRLCNVLDGHGYAVDTLLSDYGCGKAGIVRLPFLYVWGRSDGSALIYGAVIYPENIQCILLDERISALCTGLFTLEPGRDEDQNESLQLKIELEPGAEPVTKYEALFLEVVTKGLEEQNTDYRALRAAIGDNALLDIRLCRHLETDTAPGQSVKHRYIHR